MTSAKVIAPIVLGILMLALWEGAVRIAGIEPYILPGPILVAKTLVTDWGTLAPSLLVTVRITLEALAAAVAVGGLLAILFSLSRWLELSLFPYAIILQVTPIVAIAPLIIVWADNVELSLLICAWLVAFFPILSNTILGLRSVDPNLLDLFQLYGAGRWRTLVDLRLPAALPYFLGGLRISGGLALIGAVVAEFVAGLAHPRIGLSAENPAHVRGPGADLRDRHRDLPAAVLAQSPAAAALAREHVVGKLTTLSEVAYRRVARNSATGPCQIATPLSLPARLWPSLPKAPSGR